MLRTMTNKTLTRLSFAILALLAASTASAHPSGHMELTMSQMINHMLASPFHTGMIVAGVIVVSFVINAVSKRKVSKVNKAK